MSTIEVPTTTTAARTPTAASDALLRRALQLDAAASGALGAALAVASPALDEPLGLPTAVLAAVGAVLVAFAAAVWRVGTGTAAGRISTGAARAVVAVNLLWVVDSAALAVFQWGSPTGLGTVFVALQAAAVLAFADLQLLGLHRARR
ncbi:hypothetical protein [Conexibacter sp. SYSU D00693]|uniref:hypothetical protein n=1 Tax=Conexibacter sp. SYSU D00693 TaxID=2812560 RepID=UPI00196B16AA|nr:hypothetical protein [Conexibacter sp. SYSU D00693]